MGSKNGPGAEPLLRREAPSSSGTSRRSLLGALGAASLAGGLARPEHARAETHRQVADAPAINPSVDERVPFHGMYQSGIVTPRPANGMIAAFDVVVASPDELERLFRRLTERIVFLTAGGTPADLDPLLPPADSGILGPAIRPDALTITVGLGASLFDDRPWLQPLKPRVLMRMTRFSNDALDAAICHGDISLQICANTQDTTIHALRDIIKSIPDQLVLRWKQEGNVPATPPNPDGTIPSARNFLGFLDGSANPDSNDAALMEKLVWTGPAHGEPHWAANGTYQAVRVIRTLVERWDRTPLNEQELIIGRRKMSGTPLIGGESERDIPEYDSDPEGRVTPLDAHIRLANPRTPEAMKNLMLRRGFNYSNGVTRARQLDQGLLFISYHRDLLKGFIEVQRRLDGEPLEEYIRPVGGGYFFVLPGARDAADYLGRTLVEAARNSVTERIADPVTKERKA